MANYHKGRRYEYRYRDEMKKEGFSHVVRSAGSKSPFDLIAWNKDKIVGVQVKYGRFTMEELEPFKKMYFPGGNKRFVVFKPVKKGFRGGFDIVWSNEND